MVTPARLRHTASPWQRIPEVVRSIRDSPQWLTLLLGYLHVRAPTYPFEFRTRANDRLLLNTNHDLVTVWIIFFRNEYRVHPEDRIILDVGANIGTFSLFAARHAPKARIVAFEPFPATFEQLRCNIERNSLGARVETHPMAMTGEGGVRHMDVTAGSSQSRGMLQTGATTGLEVRTTTLARFLAESRLDDIDLMKMDIEGSEHEVISSTAPEILRHIRRIALEYHPNQPKRPLLDYIQAAGYRLTADVLMGADSGVASFERV